MANSSKLVHGYNETITVFFCKMVELAIKEAGQDCTDFLDFLERFPALDKFSTINEYYSPELLYSEKAQSE